MLGGKLLYLADGEQLGGRWASGIIEDFRQPRVYCYGGAAVRQLAVFCNSLLVGQPVDAHAARNQVVAQRHVPSPRLIVEHVILQVISVD